MANLEYTKPEPQEFNQQALKSGQEVPKTLKEILEYDHNNAAGFITANILRREAIKWIKEYSFFKKDKDGDKYIEFGHCDKKPVIDWIKHFFNITIEDLREV